MSEHTLSATEKISSVYILPWLRIGESIAVGDVVFYSGQEAIELLGGRGALLADRLQTYREMWTDEPAAAAVAFHALQLTNGGDAPKHSVRQATDILTIATMFENDGGFGADANATTFTLIRQRLGGEMGFVASRARRRYGGIMIGSTTDIRVPRPHYCGSFSGYDGVLLDALVAASTHPNSWRLLDALSWFRRASTDADEVDSEVDLVLMLTAVDFLLAHPKTRGAGLDQERIEQLLKPFETLVCDRVTRDKKLEERSHIQCVLYVLDTIRNATVHPRTVSRSTPYPFEQVKKIAFPWIADRCFMALLIARLVELDVLDKSSFVRAFVTGLERWISTLSEQSDQLGKLVYDVKLEYELQRVSAGVGDLDSNDSPEVLGPGAERQQRWERDFRLAFGEIPLGRSIDVEWLSDDRAYVEIYATGVDDPLHLHPIDLDDEPARTAYALQGLVYGNGSKPDPNDEVRTPDDRSRRAMEDPRRFLGAASERI